MNYKLINEALFNISKLRYNHPKFKKVSSQTVDNLRGEERQGEFNEIIEIYSLGEDNLHLKLTLNTDSYGDNEALMSIQVVKPIVKQVADFEPIN